MNSSSVTDGSVGTNSFAPGALAAGALVAGADNSTDNHGFGSPTVVTFFSTARGHSPDEVGANFKTGVTHGLDGDPHGRGDHGSNHTGGRPADHDWVSNGPLTTGSIPTGPAAGDLQGWTGGPQGYVLEHGNTLPGSSIPVTVVVTPPVGSPDGLIAVNVTVLPGVEDGVARSAGRGGFARPAWSVEQTPVRPEALPAGTLPPAAEATQRPGSNRSFDRADGADATRSDASQAAASLAAPASTGTGSHASPARVANRGGTDSAVDRTAAATAAAAGQARPVFAVAAAAPRAGDVVDGRAVDAARAQAGPQAQSPSTAGEAAAAVAAVPMKATTQIMGTPAAADGPVGGLADRAAALGAAARAAAVAAEAQLAAVAAHAAGYLRLPLAALPMGLAGGGEVGEATDAGGGFDLFDPQTFVPNAAMFLGLSPWRLRASTTEGTSRVWNVTAAGSLALAVGGYWYCNAVAARRRELEQATAAGAPARAARRPSGPVASSTPFRTAASASMIGTIDRWCRERIDG
jgi:hypothetical protein